MSKVNDIPLRELLKLTGTTFSEDELGLIFGNNGEAAAELAAINNEISKLFVRTCHKLNVDLSTQKIKKLSRVALMEPDQLTADEKTLMEDFNKRSKEINIDFEAKRDELWEKIFSLLEENADKEKLVLVSLYRRQQVLDQHLISKEHVKGFKSQIAGLMRIIGEDEFETIYLLFDETKSFAQSVVVLNSQELVNAIKQRIPVDSIHEVKQKQQNKLAKTMEIIKPMIGLVLDEDFQNIIANKETIGTAMLVQLYNNLEIIFEDDKPISERDSPQDAQIRMGVLEDLIIKNARHINIDGLLLILAYRSIENLENSEIRIAGKMVNSMTDEVRLAAIDYIHDILVRGAELLNEDAKIPKENIEGATEDYTAESMRSDLLRFTTKGYVTKKEVENIKKDVLGGRVLLKDLSEEIILAMELSKEEFDRVVNMNSENLVFVLEIFVPKEESISDVYRYIEMLEQIPNNVLETMRNRRILPSDIALDYVKRGKITTEQFEQFIPGEELNRDSLNNRIVGTYVSMKELENDEEHKKEYLETMALFNKYVSLYRNYNIAGKSAEELERNETNLIDRLGVELLNNETLTEFYMHGIISIDTAIDWGSDINDMLVKKQIKPTDVKRFYSNGIISLEQIKAVILSEELTAAEKQDLIYSTFDGISEKDEEIRNELIQLIKTEEGYKGQTNATGRRRVKAASSKSKVEYETDHFARWHLLSLIDKDYGTMPLPKGMEVNDGHRIFLLPSQGKAVIEKMYEKVDGEIKNCYGYATLIMDIDKFFENIEGKTVDGEDIGIITGGTINRTFLGKMCRAGEIDRKIHSKNWGENLLEYFNIKAKCKRLKAKDERYTEEELAKIREAAENVRKSRRLRDR